MNFWFPILLRSGNTKPSMIKKCVKRKEGIPKKQ